MSQEPAGWWLSVGVARDIDGSPVDQLIILDMPGPHSYTGEDVVELQCHGGLLVTERVLQLVLASGARLAEPGEFTKRAFLNGRLDLTQAEAVADVIAATSEAELELAWSQLRGRFGREVRRLREELLEALVMVEARLDFAVEEIEGTDLARTEQAAPAIARVRDRVAGMLSRYETARALYHGSRVVIAGKPNVGKSSLLNALVGSDRAIVTPVPGTTRDTVDSEIKLCGVRVRLTDSAGLGLATGPIDEMGMAKTREAITQASLVLAVFDRSCALDRRDDKLVQALDQRPTLAVLNKKDLPSRVAASQIRRLLPRARLVETSAVTGEGVEVLHEAIGELAAASPSSGGEVMVFHTRHRTALAVALRSLEGALAILAGSQPLELAAQELRAAAEALGGLTGEVVTEEILDGIFSAFCLGK